MKRASWISLNTLCRYCLSGLGRGGREPMLLQTLPQQQPGTVQDHPQVVRGDSEFEADLIGFKLHDLAQGEDSRGIRRQLLEAALHDLEELLLRQRRFRIAPVGRRVLPMPRVIEQRIEIVGTAFVLE